MGPGHGDTGELAPGTDAKCWPPLTARLGQGAGRVVTRKQAQLPSHELLEPGVASAGWNRTLLKHPFFLLCAAFVLGCATHAVTSTITVAAQSDPERGVYRECFGTTLELQSGRYTDAGRIGDPVRIPAGWHVVGGGGVGGSPVAILCR